jgi:hypothetical protein
MFKNFKLSENPCLIFVSIHILKFRKFQGVTYFNTSFICEHGDIMCIGLSAPTYNLLVVVPCS